MADSCAINIRQIIEHYFHLGYANNVIVQYLKRFHDIDISIRTLKRRLSDYNLRRHSNVPDSDVRDLIKEEIKGPGALKGYRALWHSLRLKYHVHVTRNQVASILREVDPVASFQRSQRRLSRRKYFSYGPDFCWHVDGYDKLKPYGFPIHGAIDGFSRKILWLKVSRSNNLPSVPASHYINYVKEISGCPVLLRTDKGTENVTMAGAQCFFRLENDDPWSGNNAHKYGTSPSNQRIEGWWSFFRKDSTDWWIGFFKDMCASGVLDLDNELNRECLWFTFNHIIQNMLDEVKNHWNTHRIRQSKYGAVAGIPNVLYHLPEDHGGISCMCPMPPQDKINAVESSLDMVNRDNIYQDYFQYVMDTENKPLPTNVSEAYNLFVHLLEVSG